MTLRLFVALELPAPAVEAVVAWRPADDPALRLVGRESLHVTLAFLGAREEADVPVIAEALADGARERLNAEIGIGVTGIAGPGGGTPEKPVGTVCFSVSDGERRLTRRVRLPGGRFDVRDRSTTVALHMLRRLLLGESD